MNLVSDHWFRVFLTAMTGGVAGTWMILDARGWWRLRDDTTGDPTIGDKKFGYLLGVAIGVIGILGCLMFWNVI